MEDSNYQPEPIDCSQVELDDLQSLVDRLAKNAHEIWARERISEGWTLGPRRDDEEKKHPYLIPYDDLPESEKRIDKIMAAQTLAAAIAMGYEIRPKAPANDDASWPSPDRPLASDDMNDKREIDFYLSQALNGESTSQPLLERLTLTQEIIHPVFRAADKAALEYQKKYETASLRSVVAGGITVFFGLLQLANVVGGFVEVLLPLPLANVVGGIVGALLPYLELAAAVVTIYYIWIASVDRYKEKWLLARYKAEKLRLLKFRFLSTPSFWHEQTDDVAAEMTASVDEIQASTYVALEDWVSRSLTPEIPSTYEPESMPPSWPEFVAYYCAKRLHPQMQYLERQESVLERKERRSAAWGTTFFFSSVAFVMAHALLHVGGAKENWTRGLIAAAAALPMAAAAVRTYRSAREFGRNANRHMATRSTLQELSTRLHLSRSLIDTYHDIHSCERVLEIDTREWLRLMKEAEWFG
jgi:hypothetical protein